MFFFFSFLFYIEVEREDKWAKKLGIFYASPNENRFKLIKSHDEREPLENDDVQLGRFVFWISATGATKTLTIDKTTSHTSTLTPQTIGYIALSIHVRCNIVQSIPI